MICAARKLKIKRRELAQEKHYVGIARFRRKSIQKWKAKRPGSFQSPAAVNSSFLALESLLQSDVPEPAFDGGKRFVVAILEAASHERRIFIQHVLHTQRDRGVVKPPLPVAAAIFSRGYRDDILLLAVFHRHVFAAVLGKARHFCRRRRWQVKRVVEDQIERRPRGHFPRATSPKHDPVGATPGLIELRGSCKTGVVILILTSPVNDRTDIQATASMCQPDHRRRY